MCVFIYICFTLNPLAEDVNSKSVPEAFAATMVQRRHSYQSLNIYVYTHKAVELIMLNCLSKEITMTATTSCQQGCMNQALQTPSKVIKFSEAHQSNLYQLQLGLDAMTPEQKQIQVSTFVAN